MAEFVRYLVTDPLVLGVVGWVSLLVTLAGFGIAFAQLRKIETASEAARQAVETAGARFRAGERAAKLHHVSSQLRMAMIYIDHENLGPAGAHIDACCFVLMELKELTSDATERRSLETGIETARRALVKVEPGMAKTAAPPQLRRVRLDLGAIKRGVDDLIVKHHYDRQKPGAEQ